MKFREVVQRVRNPSGQSRARQAGTRLAGRVGEGVSVFVSVLREDAERVADLCKREDG